MAVTREDVLRIAELARLRLSPEESARFTDDLNGILAHMEALAEPDLAAVPAMGLAAEWEAPLRDDSPGADRLAIPLTELGPAVVDNFFTVPRLPALDAGAVTDEGAAVSARGASS